MKGKRNVGYGGLFSVFGLLALALATLFLAWPSGGASAAGEACDGTDRDHPAVAAFLNSPAVAKAIANRTSPNDKPSCIFVVKIGGSCGVAGCGTKYLVGQTFTSAGVNPQTRPVLAVTETSNRAKTASPAQLVRVVPE